MECVVSGEQSGHTLYGPWELIEPYLSVMFHNNITASFRFDTMELSWTVSGSSIYWNINAPEIIGLKLDHRHHYHRRDTLILTCDESMLLRPVIVRRGRGVRRGQSCENIEQDTRKKGKYALLLKVYCPGRGCHFSSDPPEVWWQHAKPTACHPVEKHVKNVEAGWDFITFIDDTTWAHLKSSKLEQEHISRRCWTRKL